ncbi:MAG: hypothetical protein BGO41_08545 [Clostridiales bacterium 38-18]|nr:MAG: hypothetical protein BGO41_08545 [Clostridiales bacterium 38-18]
MQNNRKLILGSYFGFIVMGMIVISFGSTMPYIRESFNFNYELGGLILAIFSFSYLINGFLSGLLIDKLGHKRVLLMGNVGYVIGLVLIALSMNHVFFFIAVAVLGIGWGFYNTTGNVIMNDATKGDGKAMLLLHMSFGIGAFISPLIFGFLMKLGLTWRSFYLLLAVFSALSFAINLKLELPKLEDEEIKKTKLNQLNLKKIGLFMAILFFYVGVENGFSGWMTSYIKESTSIADTSAQSLLSVLWLTMIFGRLGIGFLGANLSKVFMVFMSSVMLILGMLVFIVSTTWLPILVSVIIIGFAMSGIYPLTLADANPYIKGSGLATALVISGGGMGASSIPYLSGKFADMWGTKAILVTITISTAILIFCTFFNWKISQIEANRQTNV